MAAKCYKKMTENDIQKQILEWLAYQQGCFWRNNSGATVAEYKGKSRLIRFGMKGSADILGILPDGRFFACEVKKKPNKPTVDQQTFLDSISYWGGVAVVAYSLEDVINIFNKK